MTTPRKPQDHKTKVSAEASAPETKAVEPLQYEALDGTVHVVDGAPLAAMITPGWLRAARKKDDLTLTFDLVEQVADDALLETLDASWAELGRFGEAFTPYWQTILGASLGESSAS